MITLTLTLDEIYKLINFHGVYYDVCLINHGWFLDRLIQIPTKELLHSGYVLTTSHYGQPTLWPVHAYIEEKRRLQKIDELTEEFHERRDERTRIADERRQRLTAIILRFNLLHLLPQLADMTIDEVLNMSTDDIEKLTPQQVEEYFAECLVYTRPETAVPVEVKEKKVKEPKEEKVKEPKPKKEDLKAEIAKILAANAEAIANAARKM